MTSVTAENENKESMMIRKETVVAADVVESMKTMAYSCVFEEHADLSDDSKPVRYCCCCVVFLQPYLLSQFPSLESSWYS